MKSKKIFITILSGLLISPFSLMTTKAYDSDNEIVFTESYTVNDALNEYQSGHLQVGESTITKEDIEAGINGQNNLNKSRMGGYTWQMTGMSTYASYGILKGNYFKKVEAGVSTSKSEDASFTIGGEIKGVKLTGSFGFSTTFTYNGPSGTEAVGDKKATHRLYSGIGYGKIMKYNFVYKDNYTGAIAATKSEYYITNQNVTKYSNLTYINPSNRSLLVRSSGSSKTKSFSSETDFKNKVNSTSPSGYIDF